MAKATILIGDRWKVVRYDALNWQLYEKREIAAKPAAIKKGTVGAVDWRPLGKFYSAPENAAAYIVDHCLDSCDASNDTQTLAEYVKSRSDEIRRLTKAVKKVEA